jgi:SAM-dependent methyltransferase
MRKFIKFLVRKIPRPYLIKFSYAFSWIVAIFYKGNKHECPICGGTYRKLLPYGNKGDDNRLCPKCLSLERHRLIWLYLKQKTNFFSDNLKVLHIAPEQSFYKRFKALENIDYYTADLESPLAQYHFDIHEIPFDENTFDVIICNHVLEHVEDEFKVTREFYRVLKPGGFAILQVPINLQFETTYEDPKITDPKEREKHFGQYDHLRWHGKDYADRLRKSGFNVEESNFVNEFSEQQIERYRLPRNEILYIARK